MFLYVETLIVGIMLTTLIGVLTVGIDWLQTILKLLVILQMAFIFGLILYNVSML